MPAKRWRAHKLEGLLLNSRMANAVIDDENPSTLGVWAYADGPWDAERSTREFIAQLPTYRAHGLLAVSVNLQGGSPQGYSWNQPWIMSGFCRRRCAEARLCQPLDERAGSGRPQRHGGDPGLLLRPPDTAPEGRGGR